MPNLVPPPKKNKFGTFPGVTNPLLGTSGQVIKACLHGGEGPKVGEVTRLGGVTRLSIKSLV